MAGIWWLVVPETTINLVNNPSGEKATTDYSAINGGAIARVTTYQRRGVYSLRCTPSANTDDGIQYALILSPSTQYTFSFDFKGVDGESYKFDLYDTTGATILGSAVTITSDGTWARYSVTATTGSNTAIKARVYKNAHASVNPFYVDGFQVEGKAYPTDYIDGDQLEGVWAAGEHTSTSSRLAQYSGAGKVVNFDAYSVTVTAPYIGAGIPPINVIQDSVAQGAGGNFRQQVINPRTLQLVLTIDGNDLAGLHALRSALIAQINPDKFAQQGPIYLRYSGSGKMLQAGFYLRGGMDSSGFGGNSDRPGLELVATDPYWYEVGRIFTASDITAGIGTGASGSSGAAGSNGGGGLSVGNSGAGLTSQEDITGVNYIISKVDGQYAKMEDGITQASIDEVDDAIYASILNPHNGYTYIAGAFESIGSTTVNGVAYWNGYEWNAMGTGIDPFGGGPWTGTNEYGLSLAYDSNGDVYLGGLITVGVGGISNTQYIAKWDISAGAWVSVASGGAPGTLTSILVEADDTIWIHYGGDDVRYLSGGTWTTPAGDTIDPTKGVIDPIMIDPTNGDLIMMEKFGENTYVWNGSTLTKSTTNVGISARTLYTAAIDSSRNIYCTGSFRESDWTPSSITGGAGIVKFPYPWTSVEALSPTSGFDVSSGELPFSIQVNENDTIYVSGNFTENSQGDSMEGVARWNGAAWEALGDSLDLDGGVGGYYINLQYNNTIAIAGEFAGAHNVSGTKNLAIWSGASFRGFLPSEVLAIEQGLDGKIYVVGGFADTDSISNTSRMAYWDPIALDWNALGTGATGVATDIAISPNGDIYAAGAFADMGGISNTQAIAYWDISASTWVSIGNVNGTIRSLAFAPNGDLYIGGAFLDAGGVANTPYIAKWDGSNWTALSAQPNGPVNDILFLPGNRMFIAGAFTKIGSTTYDYVVEYSPVTDTFSALENGTNGIISDMDVTPDGTIYLGGEFTTLGTQNANNVGAWNGSNFSALSTGTNLRVEGVKADPTNGNVYIYGAFTEAGGITLPDKIAVWRGSNFTPLDAIFPGSATITAFLITPLGDIYMGFDTSGTATVSKVN